MNFINKISAWLEKYLMPLASVIGGQRHLGAMRDGFIATLPISMAGALAVLFKSVIFTSDSLVGEMLNKIAVYQANIQPFIDKYLVTICDQVWWGTLAITTIFAIITISYSLAKSYNVDGLAAAIVSLASYFALFPQTLDISATIGGSEHIVSTWGNMNWASFNATALFTGLLVALLATQLFVKLTKRGWTIKMPEQVPPAVSRAFSSIIPGGVTILVSAIIGVFFLQVIGTSFKNFIELLIQQPLVRLGQSPITYIILVILSQLLWFFGLHGTNMVEPALNAIYGPALQDNANIVMQGGQPIYTFTKNFLDVYAMPGGAGATLGLLIAIYLFSKRQEHKELAKLAIAPGVFNINEPVIFGLPLVLNPLMFIPFVFTPALMVLIAWIFTDIIPFAGKIYVQGPWVTPPILSAYFNTGGNWQAAVLAAALFLLSILIYAPFVIAANREGEIS